MIKLKTCTKCKIKYSATTEFFPPDNQNKDKLKSWCRPCTRASIREHYRNNKNYYTNNRKSYNSTFNGRVTRLMAHIKERCYNPNCKSYKDYGGRGITLEFTRQELIDWLVENNIDPRGLEIHRKNKDANYTLNNIKFLNSSEHTKLHWRTGK